ncbi:AAA family ATPase [Bifidobacterium pullorum]|uniref:Nuclease SbcCD subunit C n=1 Tax=Bifidobacterium pullorum subsp. gallinarum TaxID=78344 RepID=A0A921LVC5_9BIFI|nr:SMC family ATPase [Bifidobacterium pullorum]HJG41328.1 SMC family ATPase [Bifidobacterium pullorum subsp. gallinarum]
MRLIGMKLKGVGPYKDEFSIDFAALSRSHMFLIEGETGAGKTTILDGITFALYGSPSVLNADKTRMRSRFLGESREVTVVDLIIELNGVFYRIRREPEYQYVTKSGKTSTHRATAKLWKIEDGLRPLIGTPEPDGGAARYFAFAEGEGHATSLAIKANDVAAEINQLVGLNRDQFSKTIMLAQGQFSEFLRMKPEDRTQLVKELFSAQEYERIQETLKTAADQQRHAMEDAQRTLSETVRLAQRNAGRILQGIREFGDSADTVAEASDQQEAADGTTGMDSSFWGLDESGNIAYPRYGVEEIVGRLNQTMTQTAMQSARLQDDLTSQTAKLEIKLRHTEDLYRQSADLVQQAQEERALVQQHVDLERQGEQIATERNQIESARKAEPVLAKQQDLEKRRCELNDTVDNLDDVLERLQEYPTAETLEEQHKRALAAAGGKDAARERLAVVETHQALLNKVAQSAKRMEEARSRYLRQRDDVLATAQEAMNGLPDETTVAERIAAYTEQLAQEPLLQERRKQAAQRLTHARKVIELEQRVAEQNAQVDELDIVCTQAEQAAEQARQEFTMLDAAKYAGMLKEGQPCPVCGSTTHPSPYQAPDDVVTERKLHALERHAKQCAEKLHQAQSELGRTKTKMEAEREAAEGSSVEEAQQAIEQADAELTKLEQAAEQLSESKRQRDEIRKAQNALQEANTQLAKLESAYQVAKQALESAQSEAAGHTEESVAAERREARHQLEEAEKQAEEAGCLNLRIKERQKLATQQTQLQAQSATLNAQIESLSGEVTALLQQQGFNNIEDAKSSALDAAAITHKQQRIDEYERRITANQTRLQDARRTLAQSIKAFVQTRKGFTSETSSDLSESASGGEQPQFVVPAVVPDAVVPDAGVLDTSGEQPVAYADNLEPTAWGSAIESIDAEMLKAACTHAQSERDAMVSRRNAAADWEQERLRCAEELNAAAQDWQRELDTYDPLYRMAQLANGGGDSPADRRLTLITYTVTERFRDVLMRANEILKDIQGGVYELRLGEHEGRGGTKTGLPIDIFDRRNEQLRPPSSLSGGETFFVSLALALALADIIQAENGGLSMETLFIDEGFGTLSDDYLDDVMGILRDIAKTRDVGIISHVGQLKDQIHERISVTRVHPDAESRLTVIV